MYTKIGAFKDSTASVSVSTVNRLIPIPNPIPAIPGDGTYSFIALPTTEGHYEAQSEILRAILSRREAAK